jgi:hypothetical protein
MLSRALSLATVMLLIGCFAADTALAQATNLEAGKSPSQIFAGTCTACHKGPRGLLKTVPAGSLQGFLKQHYTTSPEMASLLAAFLVSNGATDSRYVGSPAKPGKEEKSDLKPGGPPEQLDRFGHRLRPTPAQEAARPEAEPKEAAKPDADGIEPGRHGRNARRLVRPGETPAAEGQTPDQAAGERGPDGRRLSTKQKLSKRGKPGSEELPKSDSAKSEPGKTEPGKDESAKEETPKNETAKTETGKTETGNSDTAKVESGKPEGTKPEGAKPAEAKSESAKIETPKETGSSETPAMRVDPVAPATPAPAASPGVSAAVSSGKAEPSSGSSVQPAPPAVAASAPPPPPVAPAGPPAPPISQ